MGLRTEGPCPTDAGTKHSPGNTAGSSAGTIQPAIPFQQAAQLQSQPTAPHKQLVQPSSQPAMLYQQAVQPPRRSTGRGLLARPTSDEATPAADPTYPDWGRPQTRGRGLRGRSTSHPRQGQGIATNAPSTASPQFQLSHHSHPGPAEMAAK